MADVPESVDGFAVPSTPLDTVAPYDTSSLAGKTIVLTGGASGFGAAFARRWARHGAHLAIGDIDDAAGEALVAELRATTPGGDHHHYMHCDVTSWASQVAFFRTAAERSASGTIDAVVPNAGVSDPDGPASFRGFENPAPADGVDADGDVDGPLGPDPAAPRLTVVDVNLTGVLYTVHLALYWLARSPPGRDRHLLLISSIAGLAPLPGQALYTASKHAVTGLFRALRGTAPFQPGRLRVNMLCPYFVATPILPTAALALLAGGGMARIDDVIDAGTRFMADESLAGRAVVIGPRLVVDTDTAADATTAGRTVDLTHQNVVGVRGVGPNGQAVWECYVGDLALTEIFVTRFLRMLNMLTTVRGWVGYFKDLAGIVWSRRR